jgi:hypothetical protein
MAVNVKSKQLLAVRWGWLCWLGLYVGLISFHCKTELL